MASGLRSHYPSQMSYNALIIDDEPNNRQLLRDLLRRHCPGIISIAEAENVASALDKLEKSAPDVVFLDIEMPGGSGFDFLNNVKDIDFRVIFVTAYDAYALRAIKYSALDYLLKPVDPEELKLAVDKLDEPTSQAVQLQTLNHNLNNQQDRRISLATQDEIVFVKVHDLIHLEAQANYTKVYLENSEPLLLSGNLGHYEKLIDDTQFYRSHQSHLINTHHVSRYVKTEGGYFLMSNGTQVPVSRMKKEEVKKLFFR